jgi:D-3-phosphoglycerate dehydrogenase / 2-oxoglutarate reductase
MRSAAPISTVLLTDYAWPDIEVEREVIEKGNSRLVAGPSVAASADEIEALVTQHQPAAIMTCWAEVSRRAIEASARLRVVARLGVGLDNIAVSAATARGVWVTNVPDYCVDEVSDHAVAMALAWTRGLLKFDRQVRSGRSSPATAKLRRMSSLTCGIVGLGNIGKATARKLAAFGCRILVHTRTPDPQLNVEFADLASLLARSDIVILHLPYTAETHHMIDARALSQIKAGALLINVSRGAVVDSSALTDALRSGRVAGAALDVWEGEPEIPAPWKDHPDVLLTPHVAFSSMTSIIELRRRAAEDVVRVLSGQRPLQPCNQVSS